MSTLGQWLKRRFTPYDLSLVYFAALRHTWVDVAWGAGVPAVAFIIPWSLGYDIPRWAIALFFVWALLVAGYHSWRSDHVKLIPKFEIKEIGLVNTPTEGSDQRKLYIQLIPRCLTEVPVRECQGHLLRTSKRYSREVDWSLTKMDEPLNLEWSLNGYDPLTLQPGVPQRLNVCFSASDRQVLLPAVNPLPSRWREVFNTTGIFRFDIRVTAKECAPVDISVSVTLDERAWHDPQVEIL